MGAFGRAIADVGKGLMERNARTRELEDLAKIKAAEDQAAWDREAPKRELDKALAEQRIAASKAATEASRMSAEVSKLNALAGKTVGPDRFFAQEAVDEERRTTFIPQREEVDLSAEAKLRSRDSNARTGAIQSAADVRRQDTIAERRRQEKLALQAEQRKLELAKTKALGGYNPSKNFDVTQEQYAERVSSTYEEPLSAIKAQLESLDSGLMGGAEEIPSFDSPQAAADALRAADPSAKINLEGVAPAGPKAKINQGKSEVWAASYAEALAKGATPEIAAIIADEDDATASKGN